MAVARDRLDRRRGAADHGHLSGAPPVGAGPGSRWGVDGGGAGRRHGASDASGRVHRAEGVEGLCDRARSGRPPRLSEAQLVELARLVEAGPDPARHGVVRWRCVDLRAEIKLRFEVEISERHVGRLLKRLGFTRLSVRPRHPQADEAAQQAFKKTSPRS